MQQYSVVQWLRALEEQDACSLLSDAATDFKTNPFPRMQIADAKNSCKTIFLAK